MLGAEVRPVDSGRRDAQGRAQRGDPRLGDQRARHPLRHRLGRGPGALPRDRGRAPVGDRRRGARADARRGGAARREAVVACVGGGSNAIGIFRAFLDDDERGAGGGRGRRRGHRDRPPRRVARARAPGRAARQLLLPAPDARGPGHRAALDLGRASTTPGSGPSTASCASPGGCATRAPPTPRRSRRSRPARARRASSRRSRAPTPWRSSPASAADLGRRRRARAGLPVGARRQGRRRGRAPPSASMTDGRRARIRAAFARGRPAALHALRHGRLPRPAAASASHVAALARHADLIELGIPFSDPLADGPTIQAAGQRALEGGTRPEDVIAIAEGLRRRRPAGGADDLRQRGPGRGPRAFMERAARAGRGRRDRPGPARSTRATTSASRRAGPGVARHPAGGADHRRRAPRGDRPARRRLRLLRVGGRGHGRRGGGRRRAARASSERARARIDAPLAVGFGIRTAAHVAAVGRDRRRRDRGEPAHPA